MVREAHSTDRVPSKVIALSQTADAREAVFLVLSEVIHRETTMGHLLGIDLSPRRRIARLVNSHQSDGDL